MYDQKCHLGGNWLRAIGCPLYAQLDDASGLAHGIQLDQASLIIAVVLLSYAARTSPCIWRGGKIKGKS